MNKFKKALENKSQEEKFRALTGYYHFNEESVKTKLSEMTDEDAKNLIDRLLWMIPGALKVSNFDEFIAIREYVLSLMDTDDSSDSSDAGDSSDSSDSSDTPVEDSPEDIAKLEELNDAFAEAKAKQEAGSTLTPEEEQVLELDENGDGVLTSTDLLDHDKKGLTDIEGNDLEVVE